VADRDRATAASGGERGGGRAAREGALKALRIAPKSVQNVLGRGG